MFYKKTATQRLLTAVSIALLIFSSAAPAAWARDRREYQDRHDRHGRDHYHYSDGNWYKRPWFWFGFGAAALTLGAIVNSLPPDYETVYVNGVPYYYYDNVYYRPHLRRYIVVDKPEQTTVVVTGRQDAGAVVINVPNSDGTSTPVKLVKEKNGYRGPQGELYEGNPTVEQLRALYAR